MSTRMQGYVKVGPTPSEDLGSTKAEGILIARQSVVIGFNNTLTQNATLNIPIGSTIVDIIADVRTAYDSATSATLTAGTSSGNSAYAGSVNAKTAGRARPTFTGTQLGNLQNISNSNFVVTVTSVGQPTTGLVYVTVLYEPGPAGY